MDDSSLKSLKANFEALEAGYSTSEDRWIYDDFPAFMEITDDFLAKESY